MILMLRALVVILCLDVLCFVDLFRCTILGRKLITLHNGVMKIIFRYGLIYSDAL